MPTPWLAIVAAWRKGEDDLKETMADAGRSAPGAALIAVEDVRGDGPARTRHRGILKAEGAEVVIIIDAHMRFEGPILLKLGELVAQDGGLLCPQFFHNPGCTFDSPSPTNRGIYAGSEIVRKARFPDGQQYPLCMKWSADPLPGPRGCVGGACYAFRRQWYMDVGQPLAALPGWGGDEEALSISAWYSGHQPAVIEGRVAHRWRSRPPWILTPDQTRNIWQSRLCLINAVIQDDPAALRDLTLWQVAWLKAGQRKSLDRTYDENAHLAAWHNALNKQPRGWSQWKQTVCRPDVLEEPAVPAPQKGTAMPKHKDKPNPKPKPAAAANPVPASPPASGAGKATSSTSVARANYGSAEDRRVCHKCSSAASRVDNVRQVGRKIIRHRICLSCGQRRTTQEILA